MRSRNEREAEATSLLAAWMAANNVNYTQLAAAVGVGANAAYCWQTGRTRPRPELWFRIEEVTGGHVPATSWMRQPERSVPPQEP